MLRRLTNSISRRSTDSTAESPRSSIQTSHSSAQTPVSSIYNLRYSDGGPQPLSPSPHSSAQAPRFSEHAPRSLNQTPRSSDGAPRFSTQTPRSSDSAPLSPRRTSRYEYLRPPPADIPFDIPAWSRHDGLLARCVTNADILDKKALRAEKRWKAAELLIPLSRIHEARIWEKVRALQGIESLVRKVRTLNRREERWRKEWIPRTPLRKYPAWGSCYAEAVGVFEGEGVEPWVVVVELDRELRDWLRRIDAL
jgi:hypothetical protein